MNWSKVDIEHVFSEGHPAFYLLDVERLLMNVNTFSEAIRSSHANFTLAYSYKTNYIPAVCKALHEVGIWAEVVSEMEYELARKNGVSPEMIVVNGPVKTAALVWRSLRDGALLQIDSIEEWRVAIEYIRNYPASLFRLGLRMNAESDELPSSRFGLSIANGELQEVIQEISEYPNVRIESLHLHAIDAARVPAFFASHIKTIVDFLSTQRLDVKFINIGGGFFSSMHPDLSSQFGMEIPTIAEYGAALGKMMKELAPKTSLMVEPGAILVADAMAFACKIWAIKQRKSGFIALSTGSKYNIKPTLHGKQMPFYRLGSMRASEYQDVEISGYTCKEDDVLVHTYSGQLAVGDIFVFLNVGAYVTVFKPPFIEPDFAIYSKKGSKITCIRQRQTLNEVFSGFL